ncbi:MAG: serine/threonine-protein kinase [Dokdonella sp.]
MSEFPRIPGFEFRALIGRGGMAAVYSAVQCSLGREVAIKVVTPDDVDAADLLQRLENEARSLASLHHPNIVELYDFGRTPDGAMYYVMPLQPGGDLTRRTKPLAAEVLIPMLDSILQALAHAHATGIVHRDIKPENILFDWHARPLLADFGAALIPHKSRLTQRGTAIGSTGYMSPEHARGAHVDARSDLYGVAVLAFEMLTGRMPFEGPDALSVALAQCEQPIPRLPIKFSNWQAFFDSALAVDPARRYPNAEAMRAALHALHDEPPEILRTRVKWRVRLLISAMAIVLLGCAWLWWPRSAPQIDDDPTAIAMARGTLTPADEPAALKWFYEATERGFDTRRVATLQGQFLAQLANELQDALQKNDPPALLLVWQRWQRAVDALHAESVTEVVAQYSAVEQTLTQQLERSLDSYDRDQAVASLAMLNAWATAPTPLQALGRRVRELHTVGEHFSDRDGPELVLIRKPTTASAGFAVMAAALDPSLYQAFVADSAIAPKDCATAIAFVQGCIDRVTAKRLVQWLSTRTGQRYRIPSKDELSAAASFVTPSQAKAWTSSCNEVRTRPQLRTRPQPNVAERAWSNVRHLFGRDRTAQTLALRCDGYLAVLLDGNGDATRALNHPDALTTVLLAREVASPGDAE